MPAERRSPFRSVDLANPLTAIPSNADKTARVAHDEKRYECERCQRGRNRQAAIEAAICIGGRRCEIRLIILQGKSDGRPRFIILQKEKIKFKRSYPVVSKVRPKIVHVVR